MNTDSTNDSTRVSNADLSQADLELKSFFKNPLFFYVRQNSRAFWVGILFLLMTNIFDGIGPFIIKVAIDQLVDKKSIPEISQTVTLFIVAMIFLTICRYYWRVAFGRYHTEAAEELRNRIFKHFLKLTPKFYNKNPVGELMTLISNDVNTFRQAIGPGLLILIDAIFMSLVIVPLMCVMNLEWTFKTLVILPFVPILIYFIHKLIHKYFRVQQDRFSDLSGFSQELIAGIRPIKGYAQETNKLGAYNILSKKYEQSCNKVAMVDGFFIPIMDLGVTLGSVILLFIASPELLAGTVTIGTFVAFQRYIERMVWPMTALGIGVSNYQRGRASFERIKETLQQKPAVVDAGEIELPRIESLQIKNLDFQYNDNELLNLKNINFELNQGEVLGVLGPIGSGKTTLVNLLVRLYEIKSGQILINGKDIKQYSLASLRRQIRVVPQDVFLFSETIRNNFLFPRMPNENGPSAEILADKVQIRNEIESLPQKFESELGERGINLSGGQKQRVSIGRGLSQDISLLVLDDSLSAVDLMTEASINREIALAKVAQKSLIIISHRLNNLKLVDKLLVLKDGMVEEFGSRQEVLSKSATVKSLIELQGVEL